MKKFATKLFRKGWAQSDKADRDELISLFDFYKVTLLEIYNFKSKRIGNGLTVVRQQKISIEQTWPNTGQAVFDMYRVLCDVSIELGVEPLPVEATFSFKRTLQTLIRLLESITHHLISTPNDQYFSAKALKTMNNRMQTIQTVINRLHTYVIADFNYKIEAYDQPKLILDEIAPENLITLINV